jgi:sialate O-acetylesterase
MKKRTTTALLILIMSGFLTAFADVRLPAIIGSHMVLQQNSIVKLWGWCDPSEKISISTDWDSTTFNTTGESIGKWMIQIKTAAAGGPYKLMIKGSNTIILEDVMIGEVWGCSGQSNMEMSYSPDMKKYTSDVENAINKNIRFFHIPRLSADYPQDDTKAKWVVCNPEDMKRFSLAGYFFGDKVQRTLNVPVGLINASWGGTPAETWTPKDTIESMPVLKGIADQLKSVPWGPVKAGAAYNAMIYPITNFTIAGILWYQGEANVGNASTYNLLFTTMINSWRKAWQKDFPFYFVQIAPFAGYGNNISSALLREAQTKALSIPNTGMIVISDLVTDTNDIHPTNKKDVGLRLANSVLAEVYGKKEIAWKSPMYKNMQTEKGGKIRVYFDNAEEGLISKGGAPSEFYIAGEDRKFVPATAKIERNSIVVWNKNIPAPAAVRLGFTSAAIPNLFNKDGLPVNIFRTDDWDDINTRQ